MIRMNAAAELDGRSFTEAAALLDSDGKPQSAARRSFFATLFGPDFWRLTGEHLLLVFVSLAASIAVGVPLGVIAAKVPKSEQIVLGAVGLIQTIPSLALLAFLIALTGTIGTWPALIALFLYALLPIVRNTCTGLTGIVRGMRQAAMALGLEARDRLCLIEVPLGLPSIVAAGLVFALIFGVRQSVALFIGPLNSATGLGIAAISLAFACAQLMWGITQPIAGAVADKYGTGRVIAAGAVLVMIGTVLTPYATSTWMLVLLIGVVAAGRGGLAPACGRVSAGARAVAAREGRLAQGGVQPPGPLRRV